MKKALSIVLAAAIIFTLLVVAPIATEAKKSGDFVYTVTDGEAEITTYTGTESELAIPSEFDGVPVKSIGGQAFDENSSLKSVIIPDSVIKIGVSAFYNCGALENVIIGNSVTCIDGCVFYCCYNLKNITFPDSLRSIGHLAFDWTQWLENQPDGIVYAGKVAYKVKGECSAEVELKEGTTGIAELAFCNYNDLKSVIVPDSVIDIGNSAFKSCKNLESVSLGNSVNKIGEYAFSNCVSLGSITIPESVTSIGGYALTNCVSLESITIPESITRIESGAFSHCASLESFTIPESVTSIGSSAFSQCVSLERVTILNSNTYIDYYAFDGCNSLIIYGYRNSTAEKYASIHNIPFIPLDGEPSTEPTTQEPTQAISEPSTQAHSEPTTQAPTEPEVQAIIGDVDGDGKVTISDATAIQKYLAEMDIPYPIGEPVK